MSLKLASNGSEKIIPDAKPEGRKKRGWRKLSWEDEVDNDVKALGERNRKHLARNRQILQNLLRKAVAQKGLFCQ
jgi:hypothetical protein